MKILSLSGSISEIATIAGAATELMEEKGSAYTRIIGVGPGGFLALPLALYKFDEIAELVCTLKVADFFSGGHFRSNGKVSLSGLIRIALGKSSVGKFSVRHLYSQLVTEEEFHNYKQQFHQGLHPRAGVLNIGTGASNFVMTYANHVSYEFWLDAIEACMALPFWCEPRTSMHGVDLFSGEVRAHVPTIFHLEGPNSINPNNITAIDEVYAREKHDLTSVCLDSQKKLKTSIDYYRWSSEVMMEQLSIYNQFYSSLWCKMNKVELRQFFTGKNIDGIWSFSESALAQAYTKGMRTIQHQ